MGISLHPDDFVTGGLIDDVDVTWKNVKFEMFAYGKQGGVSAPCLGVDLVESDGDTTRQYWSAGNATDWKPSDDGLTLVPIGTAQNLRQSTNLFILIKSLLDAGFPAAKLKDGSATAFEGLRAHMVRQKAPERTGLKKEKKVDPKTGKAYDDTILVVSKLIGEAPVAAQPAAPQAGNTAVADEAKGVLVGLIASNNGRVAKKDMINLAYAQLGANPQKNAIVGLLFQESWIKSNGFAVSGDGFVTIA